jgi:histone-lysine N-methyltransferase SETD3
MATSSGSLTSSMADDDFSSSFPDDLPPGQALMEWLEQNGAPQDALELLPFPDAAAFSSSSPSQPSSSASSAPRIARPAADVAVARVPLQPGDVALSVPERLVLTLGRVVGSDDLAEKLTAGKLSELSVLSLMLAFEKKVGRKSRWRPFIRELDRQRARSAAAGGAESPLLWGEGEAARLLQGSPVVGQVEARLQGIKDEYDQLDTVWFMVSG